MNVHGLNIKTGGLVIDLHREKPHLWVETPEDFEALRQELEAYGYELDDLRQKTRLDYPVEIMEKQGMALFYASLYQATHKVKCRSCGRYIDNRGVQTHNHQCEYCHEPTFLLIAPGTELIFGFDANSRYVNNLQMTVHHWDEAAGFIYFKDEFLQSGLGGCNPTVGEAILAANKDKWEYVVDEQDQELLIKIAFTSVDDENPPAIFVYDVIRSQRNYTELRVWEGVEYSPYGEFPVPQSIYIHLSYLISQ